GAAKKDRIDARKGLELFQLRDHLPLAKGVLQEVTGTPKENEILKRLTRRRRRLVNERVRVGPCPNCCGKRERRILSVSQKPTGSWSESDRGGTRLWEKVYKDWRQWKDYLGRIG